MHTTPDNSDSYASDEALDQRQDFPSMTQIQDSFGYNPDSRRHPQKSKMSSIINPYDSAPMGSGPMGYEYPEMNTDQRKSRMIGQRNHRVMQQLHSPPPLAESALNFTSHPSPPTSMTGDSHAERLPFNDYLDTDKRTTHVSHCRRLLGCGIDQNLQ